MNETTKLMERDALRAFNEGEQASLEWQELGKELRVLLKNIERWGKPLVGDANSLESFDLNLLGESMKDSLAEILEKSLIGIGGGNMNNNNSNNSNNTQLGGINLVQQSIDENLFKWQDAITDVIEDLTNLRLEAASKGQTANEETLKRALNQAKVASESFLISSGNNRTGDDEEEDPRDEFDSKSIVLVRRTKRRFRYTNASRERKVESGKPSKTRIHGLVLISFFFFDSFISTHAHCKTLLYTAARRKAAALLLTYSTFQMLFVSRRRKSFFGSGQLIHMVFGSVLSG